MIEKVLIEAFYLSGNLETYLKHQEILNDKYVSIKDLMSTTREQFVSFSYNGGGGIPQEAGEHNVELRTLKIKGKGENNRNHDNFLFVFTASKCYTTIELRLWSWFFM